MSTEQSTVIPEGFNLQHGVRPVTGQDGVECLEFSSSMHTLYWQTYGEHSVFFQALIDGRLIGAKCPKCGMVLVPPMTWHCPDCNFQQMESVDLPHFGRLAATAPITIFPLASKHGEAPYCRGYVDVVTGASKASFMPARLETTTGLPRPGIFTKGISLRLVFEDEREGRITDVFWIPESEVPEHLRSESLLLASQLQFSDPKPPEIQHTEAMEGVFCEALAALQGMADTATRSLRAQENLRSLGDLEIDVKTSGGNAALRVHDGVLSVYLVGGEGVKDSETLPDFVMQAEDPAVFSNWVNSGSLTDAAVEGRLWLPHRQAFSALPALDRVPRSVRRDTEEEKLSAES
jgi:uncharacterized protein